MTDTPRDTPSTSIMSNRTRRSSLMPAPRKTSNQPVAKTAKTKTDRPTKIPEFVSSQDFNFDAPLPCSPEGPMTRSRRSSIYGLRGTTLGLRSQNKSPGTSKKPMASIKETNDNDLSQSNLDRRSRKSSVAPLHNSKQNLSKSSSKTGSVKSSKSSDSKKSPKISRANLITKRTSTKSSKTSASSKTSEPTVVVKSSRPLTKIVKSEIRRSSSKVEMKYAQDEIKPHSLNDNSLNQDVQVILERLVETPDIKEAMERREMSQRQSEMHSSPNPQDRVPENSSSRRKIVQIQETYFSPRVTRSIRKIKKTPFNKLKFGPASSKSSPNSQAIAQGAKKKPLPFSGTPQSMNPMDVLKKNLQEKVNHQMEDTIAQLPSNTSPYLMTEEETENGSANIKFTKLIGAPPKSAKAAVKYLTATPGLRQIRPRGALIELDGNTPQSGPSMTSTSLSRLTLKRSTPMKIRPLLLFNEEEDEKEEEENNENTPNNTNINQSGEISMEQGPPRSPIHVDAQMITGDLARACLIM